MDNHRTHVRGSDGVTHDVRVWRIKTTACGVVFDLGREGREVDAPVDCLACLGAPRTPYAVLCDDHGQQFLTEEQYEHQMDRPDALWRCPRCGESAHWDDDNYEAAMYGDE